MNSSVKVNCTSPIFSFLEWNEWSSTALPECHRTWYGLHRRDTPEPFLYHCSMCPACWRGTASVWSNRESFSEGSLQTWLYFEEQLFQPGFPWKSSAKVSCLIISSWSALCAFGGFFSEFLSFSTTESAALSCESSFKLVFGLPIGWSLCSASAFSLNFSVPGC